MGSKIFSILRANYNFWGCCDAEQANEGNEMEVFKSFWMPLFQCLVIVLVYILKQQNPFFPSHSFYSYFWSWLDICENNTTFDVSGWECQAKYLHSKSLPSNFELVGAIFQSTVFLSILEITERKPSASPTKVARGKINMVLYIHELVSNIFQPIWFTWQQKLSLLPQLGNKNPTTG